MNEENKEYSNENFFQTYKNVLVAYLEERVELMQLSLVEKTAILTAKMASSILIMLLLMVSFFFASLVFALYLGQIYHSNFIGFLIVAAIYIALCVFVLLFKNKVEKPIINLVIRQLLKREGNSKN